MQYKITKNDNGALVGFSPVSTLEPTPCQVICADVLPSVTLCYYGTELDWLHELRFADGDVLWVRALSFNDAVVTALLHRNSPIPPESILEYDLYELSQKGISEPVRFSISGAALDILPHLNTDNRDLVSQALYYINGATVEELIEWEKQRIRNTIHLEQRLATELNADEVRRVSSYIWSNYILFESTDASMNIRRLHSSISRSDDALACLFWTYVFELWARYDCHMPYSLYRSIIDGTFEPFLSELHAHREIFL